MRAIDFKDLPEQPMTRRDIVGEQYNRHLLDAETAGTPTIAGDRIRFPKNFVHKMHRHPLADQIMFILDGTMIAFDESGEKSMGPESMLIFPRNTWHGVRTRDEGAEVINLFTAGSFDAAGYDEHPEADAFR
jgi:quercetin dioxygenase-like cupin family protein